MDNLINILYALSALIAIWLIIVFIEILLKEKYVTPTNDLAWKRGLAINWPDDKYVVYLVAPYSSKDILDAAKALIDVQYPFRVAPYGGTFVCIRRREYYLNQYLWFYQRYGRLPRYEKIVDTYPWVGFSWSGDSCGYEEHRWQSFDGSAVKEK